MKSSLECKGTLVNIQGHNIHIYSQGDKDKSRIVLILVNLQKQALEAIVENVGYKECPALIIKSNGKQTAGLWSECQKEFAAILNAKLISYDCGHYIHHYKSHEICEEIIKFVNSLE